MADLRERFESWREARVRARLAWLLGDVDAPDFERADEEHLDVTSGDALAEVRAEASEASFEDARERQRRMLGALSSAAVARSTRALAARAPARPDAVELREELVARESESLAALGHANARAFAETLRPGVDYAAWSSAAEQLLEATGAAFQDALRSLRPLDWADALPASRLHAALDFALEGLGVPLARAPGLHVDGTPHPAARALAFAAAPRVPGEIWLVGEARAGIAPLESLFAAAGEALQAAFTSPSLALELRVLGDPATALAWRFLLPQLLADASFAEAGPAGGRADAFGMVLRARRLGAARRTAALVAPELALAELAPGSDPHGLESLYAERVESAVGQAPDESAFLLECSARLGKVDELRALAFASGLAQHLRERFGRRFWSERAAGELLLELWSAGTRYPPEALARELGLAPLGADSLARALL